MESPIKLRDSVLMRKMSILRVGSLMLIPRGVFIKSLLMDRYSKI